MPLFIINFQPRYSLKVLFKKCMGELMKSIFNTRVLTQINMIQQESTQVRHGSTRVRHVPARVGRESTRV